MSQTADHVADAHRAALAAGQECLAAALDYLRRGWSALAICPPDHVGVGKTHAKTCKNPGKAPWGEWKTYQERLPIEDELRRKWRDNPQLNVGIALGPVSGLVRIDIDSLEGEEQLAAMSKGDLPTTLEFTSGKGRGLLFKIPDGVKLKTTPFKGNDKKESFRFQAKGAQTILPPSRHKESGRLYRWIEGRGPGEIEPALMPAWLIERMKVDEMGNGSSHAARGPFDLIAGDDVLKRAAAYVAKMPPAIAGQGGHDQTFAVACKLVLGFALSVEAALPLLEEYNQHCEPPWTEAELLHKLEDADKQPGDRGYLLGHHTVTNGQEIEIDAGDGKTKTIRRGLPADNIVRQIHAVAAGWPKCVDEQLFAEGDGHKPLWLDSQAALFAWLARQCGGHEHPIHWTDRAANVVSRGELVEHLRQTAERFDSVESFPHHPPLPRSYYMHPEPRGRDGKALQALVERFEPETMIDADLIRCFFVSLVWGGLPGQRPAWLFTTAEDEDGRGKGKSWIAKAGGLLCGGVIMASDKEDMPRLITRLLSHTAYGQRVILLDNIKSLKFSWGELEAIITSDIISGHRMYFGDGRRPNTMTWCLTVNGASLSRDMAQRVIVVIVKRPEYCASWEDQTKALIEERRWEIIGDCLAVLRTKPQQQLAKYSRWAAWEAGVLAHAAAEPSDCQRVILERQAVIDEDAREAGTVRQGFIEELRARGHDPETETVWIPAATAAGIVCQAMGEKLPTHKATGYLRILTIPELRRSDRGHGKGFTWHGRKASATAVAVMLQERPRDTWELQAQ